MTIYDEYRQKLRTPEEAVQVVKDGDWIDYTISQGQPVLLDAALAKRKGELKDVNCRGYFMFEPLQIVEQDPERVARFGGDFHGVRTASGGCTGNEYPPDADECQPEKSAFRDAGYRLRMTKPGRVSG